MELVSLIICAHRILQGGLGVDGRKILELTLKKWVSIREIGLIRLGIIGEPF